MNALKLICFTICIVSILAAVIVGLLMVWDVLDDPMSWRYLLTAMIFFLGAGAVLSVSRVMAR